MRLERHLAALALALISSGVPYLATTLRRACTSGLPGSSMKRLISSSVSWLMRNSSLIITISSGPVFLLKTSLPLHHAKTWPDDTTTQEVLTKDSRGRKILRVRKHKSAPLDHSKKPPEGYPPGGGVHYSTAPGAVVPYRGPCRPFPRG